MSNLVNMSKAIQRLLREEELKDISSQVRNGDTLKIILANGGEYYFEIQGNAGGEFIIKDVNNNEQFRFNKSDFKDDILTVYPYTGGMSKNEGGVDYKVSNMVFDVAGTTYDIDPIYTKNEPEAEPEGEEVEPEQPNEPEGEPEGEEGLSPEKEQELQASKSDFNDRLLESKVNDILFINTGIDAEDGTFEEHAELEFVVVNESDSFIQINLANASGPKSAFYYNHYNNKQVFIKKSELISLEGNGLQLPSFYNEKGETIGVNIVNIIAVSNNVKNPTNQPQKTVKGLSKQSTVDYINQNHPDVWSKQPGLWDTIKGASPTGLYQIGKILNKSKLNNSYLKKGTKVRFIVIDGKEITGVYKNTTLRLNPKETKGYSGIMSKDKVIKSGGHSDKVHWEIELMEEVEPNLYKVKYYFCIKADKCTVKQLGSIRIINIDN